MLIIFYNNNFMYISQLTETDQAQYKDFPLVISERWQSEVAETVFETINQEADKMEHKKKAKQKQKFDADEKGIYYIVFDTRARITARNFYLQGRV